MILDSLPQIEWAPKVVCAKTGKNCLTLCYFDFFKIFWSRTLKNYYINDFFQFLELFEPKKIFFRKNSKSHNFQNFFNFFWKMTVIQPYLTP